MRTLRRMGVAIATAAVISPYARSARGDDNPIPLPQPQSPSPFVVPTKMASPQSAPASAVPYRSVGPAVYAYARWPAPARHAVALCLVWAPRLNSPDLWRKSPGRRVEPVHRPARLGGAPPVVRLLQPGDGLAAGCRRGRRRRGSGGGWDERSGRSGRLSPAPTRRRRWPVGRGRRRRGGRDRPGRRGWGRAAAGAGGAADFFNTEEFASTGVNPFAGGSFSQTPMIGDLAPLPTVPKVSPIPRVARSIVAPSVRDFKIAENQSPIPQDRVYFNYNFYDNVNGKLNKDFDIPLKYMKINRYIWGFEKTFNNGYGSFGVTLPLNDISAASSEANIPTGGTFNAMGDLTVYLKHILWVDAKAGNLTSAGVAITPPTGPHPFAGSKFLRPSNTLTIQPYFGYYLTLSERFFLHGFESIDAPADPAQPLMLYNDVGVGYYLYRNSGPNPIIRAIIPTFEMHANIPINHNDPYNRLDNFGTPYTVDLTYGLNFQLLDRATLTWAFVTPVTGPKPFSYETTVLLNFYFGRTARRAPIAPPIIGG